MGLLQPCVSQQADNYGHKEGKCVFFFFLKSCLLLSHLFVVTVKFGAQFYCSEIWTPVKQLEVMGCISLLRAWKSKLGFGDTGNQSSSTKEHEILSHGKITNANQRYIAADEVRNKRPNSVSSEKKRVKQTDAVTPSSPHGKIIPSQPASPAQTPSHHIPQILVSFTPWSSRWKVTIYQTNGLLTPPAIDQPEGSKNHKRTHTGSSAGSNRSSGHSPCSLTLNGPAEGEGDLSDVKASSIRSYGLEARNQLSEPELACKSDCLSLVDGISKLANDYNKHDTLEENLYGARIEWPKKMQTHFIPADALVQLVTAESIQRELEKCSVHCPPNKTVSDIAKETWEDASKLFATLVCLNKQHTIAEFLEEGFKDEDLPFIRSENTDPKAFPTLHSTLSKEKIVKCMSSNQWKLAQLEEFTLHQWWMMAPIFTRPDREVKFLVLEDQCPLPFTDDQEQGDQRQAGGYSCVWPVRIHSAHQRLVPISDDQVCWSLPLLYLHRLTCHRMKIFRLLSNDYIPPPSPIFELRSRCLSPLASTQTLI